VIIVVWMDDVHKMMVVSGALMVWCSGEGEGKIETWLSSEESDKC
jgi:hypothetical protein